MEKPDTAQSGPSAEETLHAAICNAVILLNNGEEFAPRVSAVLRAALAEYIPTPTPTTPPAGARDAVTDYVAAKEALREWGETPRNVGRDLDDSERDELNRLSDAVDDAYEAMKALAGKADGGELLTDTYIQTVPDKCDRIIWRGQYHHLPVSPQPAATGTGDIDYIGPPATMPTDHEKWMALYVIRMVERGIDADSAWALCRAGESDHDYRSDPAEAADNEITVFDHDGDMA